MKSDEILFANMVIGYFIPTGTSWPCPFQSLRLQLTGIQRPIDVTYKGERRQSKPEVVLAAEESDYSICLEVKTRRVSEDQVGRYAALDGASLRRGLGMKSIANAANDVVFMTEHDNIASLHANLRTCYNSLRPYFRSLEFPVLCKADATVSLTSGSFLHPEVDKEFREGISAPSIEDAPTHFVRFTDESPESDMLVDVLNAVHQQIMREQPFTTRDLCKIIVSYWDQRGNQEVNSFIKKVNRILTKMAAEDYRTYIQLDNFDVADRGSKVWKPVGAKMTDRRLLGLGKSRDNFLHKYRNATSEAFRSGQAPLFS